MQQLDTLVIGGGQAGLAISCYLSQMGREHLILEKERLVKAWRDERWDSFTLVTPNWALRLPDGARARRPGNEAGDCARSQGKPDGGRQVRAGV